MATTFTAAPSIQASAGQVYHGQNTPAGLKPTERLFIEKTLIRMYPRLQRHDLFPWTLLDGPLIPDFLVQNTSPTQIRRIVEIGCGDGVLSNILSLLFPDIEIIGIDRDPRLITAAKATVGYRQNLKFICGNPVTMTDIPCDRIIYNRCLDKAENTYAFRKLLVKTTDWLVNEGDFIVREAPLRMVNNLSLIKEFLPRLREKRSLEACIRSVLRDIGYPNPVIYSHGRFAACPSEVFYRSPKCLTLTGMVASPVCNLVGEWQDWGDQSNESLVGFLFADQIGDFRPELV